MKKIIAALFLVFTIILSGCEIKTNTKNSDYFGNFKAEPMYQQIVKLENSTDPEKMVSILEDIYKEKVLYISLEFDEKKNAFKEPYEEFNFNVYNVYRGEKDKEGIQTDVYAFFVEYSEVPLFIMDKDGSYLVTDYRVTTKEDGTYLHSVDAFFLSDLYLCLHEYAYCDGDENQRKAYSSIVKSMDKYISFEKLLADHIAKN